MFSNAEDNCCLIDMMEENVLNEIAGIRVSTFDGFDFFVHPKTKPFLFSFQKGNDRYFFRLKKYDMVYLGKAPDTLLKNNLSQWVKSRFVKILDAMGDTFSNKKPTVFT